MLLQAGGRLAAEIAVRDEVDQRLQLLEALESGRVPTNAALLEGLREIHTQIRSLVKAAPDGALRESLRDVSDKLVGLTNGDAPDKEVTLTSRQVDVLAHIALRCSNITVAQRLSIKPETVKSYLRGAMNRLDAHSRHEAVTRARRLGLLP
jgi:DNA-binding NarL/FixJ family response regulator